VVLGVTASGGVEEYTDAVQSAIKSKVAAELGVIESSVSLSVTPASVRLLLTILYKSETDAAAGASVLAQKMATASDATLFLSTPELTIFVDAIDIAPTLVEAGGDPYAGRVMNAVLGGMAAVFLIAIALIAWRLRAKRVRIVKAKAEAAKAKAEAQAEAEAAGVRAACDAEAKAKECSFWWVSAKALRESEDKTLPNLQDLRKRGDGFVEKRKVTRRDSVAGAYATKYLTISHRWLGGFGQPPDPTGTQLKAVRTYLLSHPDIEWVWFECVSHCNSNSSLVCLLCAPFVHAYLSLYAAHLC